VCGDAYEAERASHSLHTVLAAEAVKLPLTQAAHCPPTSAPNVPAGHAWQANADALSSKPAAHRHASSAMLVAGEFAPA
jgi:hypothetical protein